MISWTERVPGQGRYDQQYPPHYSFARPAAFIAFYIVILAANAMHLLLLAKARKEGDAQIPRWSKYLLLTTALSFILAFVSVVYGWHGAGTKYTLEEVHDQTFEVQPLTWEILNRGPNPKDHLATLDPFTWNCVFVPLLEIGHRQQPRFFVKPLASFKSMCGQGECHESTSVALPRELST